MKVYMMKPSEIKLAPWNPALRTDAEYMMELLADIEEYGIESPLQMGKDGMLGDGHRRLECAKILGIESVPVIKSRKRTAAELYLTNWGRISKSTKGAEWLQAVSQGFPIDLVPQPYRNQIKTMVRIHPDEELSNIAADGQSPYIVSFAMFVGRHIGDTSDETLRKIVLWFRKHGVQYQARKAIEEGCSPEVAKQAIEEDRPIRIIHL